MIEHTCEGLNGVKFFKHNFKSVYVYKSLMLINIGLYDGINLSLDINNCPFCGKSQKQIWNGE